MLSRVHCVHFRLSVKVSKEMRMPALVIRVLSHIDRELRARLPLCGLFSKHIMANSSIVFIIKMITITEQLYTIQIRVALPFEIHFLRKNKTQ